MATRAARRRATSALILLTVAAALSIVGCSEDDGASTREAGSVVIIGPPPPGGGGSVSAVGTGCTTRGATTKVPTASVQIALDEHSITPPTSIAAGVNRLVVKNFGADPHEVVITRASSADDLPVAGGAVDIEALAQPTFRIMEFPGNTICEGTFELPAGTYVVFSNLEGANGTDFEQGMVATLVVS